MTDKEQVIIDGVDVSGCGHLEDKEACGSMDCQSIECEKNPNCLFKQLARKTQECEELKENLNNSEKWRIKSEELNKNFELENTRYRKALEEIEEYVKDLKRDICNNCGWHNTDNCNPVGNVCETLGTILDIIRKAKGEE